MIITGLADRSAWVAVIVAVPALMPIMDSGSPLCVVDADNMMLASVAFQFIVLSVAKAGCTVPMIVLVSPAANSNESGATLIESAASGVTVKRKESEIVGELTDVAVIVAVPTVKVAIRQL